jgi:hypothetical protein
LAGRFEYIEFCSVVKLPVLTNMQKTVVYPQLPALGSLQAAVLVICASGIVEDQPVLMPLPFRHE